MKETFSKFPSTPHLAALHDTDIRDDKVMTESEREGFLEQEVTVEEKVDGANLGISFAADGAVRAQNRGKILSLPGSGQWHELTRWLDIHCDELFDLLSDQYILFGEWCYAQHSVFYNRLPDWFMAFDIYDRSAERFLSVMRRDRLLSQVSLATVPFIAHGRFTYTDIVGFLSASALGDQPAEGVYLRSDDGDWLQQRAKLVRPTFIQTIDEHWSRSALKPNRLCYQMPR